MGFKIETITAFISIDPWDGDEGIIGVPLPGNGSISMPAIAADGDRAKDLYPHVKSYCKAMGVEFRIIRMDIRSDVTDQFKKLYDDEH